MVMKPQGKAECHRCGGKHDAQEWGFTKAKCFACERVGHMKTMHSNKSLETSTWKKKKIQRRRLGSLTYRVAQKTRGSKT